MWFCRQVCWSTADGETALELSLLLQNIVATVWSWMGYIFASVILYLKGSIAGLVEFNAGSAQI